MAAAAGADQIASDALDAMEKDVGAFLGVLYAALAERDQPATTADRLALLNAKPDAAADFAAVRVLANALLKEHDSSDASALPALVRGDVTGTDMVVLTALACRRAGGDTWQAFRGESARLLGHQPLPGRVIVLIGRLDNAAFASW